MLSDEIVQRFEIWLAEAKADKTLHEPTAMCLATADRNGHPSARIVLLKGFDARGFVFFSNGESRKAVELMENTHAALCFHWMNKGRQVRVEGLVVPVSREECDAYFSSRHRESQVGAWASQQSRTMPGREVLEETIAQYEEKFAGLPIPARRTGSAGASYPTAWNSGRNAPSACMTAISMCVMAMAGRA